MFYILCKEEDMFKLTTTVNKGILFIDLEGSLNNYTFKNFETEINYLLYNQGINYFVINFKNINNIHQNIFNKIQNKLVEIFLTSGEVAVCGLDKKSEKLLGERGSNLFYITEKKEAFKYLYV